MDGLETSSQLQFLNTQMCAGADTDRSVIEGSRLCLSCCDQLAERLDAFGWGDDQHIRHAAQWSDAGEIFGWIVRELGINRRRNGVSVGMSQQRVAVRLRPGDRADCNRASCANAVFNDDRLSQLRRQLLEHRARDEVGGTTGPKRNKDPD